MFAWARRLWVRRKFRHHKVDFSFDASDLTLSIDDFARSYIDPAIEKLAADIERQYPMPPWHKRLWFRLRQLLPWWKPEPKPAPTLLTIDEITTKAVALLHQRSDCPYKPGQSLRLRMPVQYTVHPGRK